MWKSPIALLMITPLLLQSGCTVVGLGIGAAMDAHKPDSVTVQGWRLTTIEPGSSLTVTLSNGSTTTGTFNKGIAASAEWIDTLYMRARSNDPGCAILPALGDTVEFIQRTGRVRGRIDNAASRPLDSGCDFCFGFAPVDSSEERELCLSHLFVVRRLNGGLLKSGDIANALAQSHTLAPFAAIEMTTNTGTQQMPLDCVSLITMPTPKHGKRNGFLIGAAIDLLVIGGLATLSNGGLVSIGSF